MARGVAERSRARAQVLAVALATSACADRSLDAAGDTASESGSEAAGTTAAPTTATSVATSASSADTGGTTSTSSSSSGPSPRYDVGGGPKLDVVGGEPPPPFSCDATPLPRELMPCGTFEAPWGWARVHCVDPPSLGECAPPDDPTVTGTFEACSRCGGHIADGPCGPLLGADGSCCYWASWEDGYCPTG